MSKRRTKEEIDKAWLDDLVSRAKVYWKDKRKQPERGGLVWLLVPKYGLDVTTAIVNARLYLRDERPLRDFVLKKNPSVEAE